MAPSKKKTAETSELSEPNSTGSLVPLGPEEVPAPLMRVMTQTREEMSTRLKSLLSTIRESILSEVTVMQSSVTEAALEEVADRLVELNVQLSQPTSPLTIVLLPALRRKATALEASLSTLYQQTGLDRESSESAAKGAVRSLVPNCPA